MSLVRTYLKRGASVTIAREWETEPPEDVHDPEAWDGCDESFDEFCARVKRLQGEVRNHPPWQWCGILVTVDWCDFEGNDYLGACSYESQADFKDSGYYEDMVEAAFDNLEENIHNHLTIFVFNWGSR